ncbi:MAG TPA: PP2C family protein-serine/threonine phosphatase [Terracidiphilus sp.]|nr:PP2C family protein-serine/threonine phosphatase [Terracidiphilus sp.]
MRIVLGQSAVPLYGPWKFTVGDSPVDPVTHQPAWANPAYDDSKWETVDLTPATGALNPINGMSGNVPGWTARGHAGYWGYAWYRIHVRIESAPGVDLALAAPGQVDDAYQLFDDGSYVGAFGNFSSRRPRINYAQPMMFPLSRAADTSAGASMRLIAFRVWMQPQTLTQASEVGGFETAPIVGERTAIAAIQQVQFDELVRAYFWQPIEAAVFGLLGLIAFSLVLFDRSDRVYLWIGGLLLMIALDALSGTFAVWSTSVSAFYDSISHDVVLFSLEYAGWVMVWRAWFRQQRPRWIPWALIPLAAVLMLSHALSQNLFFTVVSAPVAAAAAAVSLSVRLILSAFLLYVVVKGIREQGLEGWLVLPAVLLTAAAEFTRELQSFGLPTVWFPFHVQITLPVASRLLLVLVLAILLLRRLILSIRGQRLMALDVKQAQEVQRVILPESRTSVPGLLIESEYRPARQVGGDFFQIIPHPTDGSLLVVAGDVAGKGLQAGMLVALLVGAIRSTAETTSDPLALLQALNRRLIGRNEAHATCLALRISADGVVTLANAGHVPPFLNGEPVAMDGALPLGVIERADFSTTRFMLQPSDRLVLASDGLAEAMNAERELFGFDRVQALVREGKTATELANVIQLFGQEDDVSVIAVTREAAPSLTREEPAIA